MASDDESSSSDDSKSKSARASMDLPRHFGDRKRRERPTQNGHRAGRYSFDRYRDRDVVDKGPVTKYDLMSSSELEEEKSRVLRDIRQVNECTVLILQSLILQSLTNPASAAISSSRSKLSYLYWPVHGHQANITT